ncbi:MAG: DUF2207 domain-containing protein [Flavobacteriaceae bacterium]|nr:DUF2207 domain-containing protein [Flavobacteriaceae bacterium]
MKFFTQLLLCGCLVLFGFTAFSQGFDVEGYEVDIYIHEEGYFDVVEKYDVYFNMQKHGIYRDIQTKYDLTTETGEMEKREIGISTIDVPDHKFEVSSKFEQRFNNYLRIKIGDPNRKIQGPVKYEIRYRVDHAFLFEKAATRFYWNLKPTLWYAPFKKMNFQVHLPSGMNLDDNDVFLYAGPSGFTEPTEDFNVTVQNGVITATSRSGYISHYGDAVTILANLPKERITEIKHPWPFWKDYGWTLILGLLGMIFYGIFQRHGKDDPAPAITSYYPPDQMDPAMAGFLMNDRGDTRDLIAFIPYWGSQGLIEVKNIENSGLFAKDDTQLIKLKDLPSGRPHYERKIFDGLFSGRNEVLVSSLRNKFYSKMSTAKSLLKKAAQRYYIPQSRKVLGWVALVLVLGIFILTPLFLYFWGFLAAIVAFVSCVVLLIFNSFMIKKNRHGTRVLSELKGFKQFIKTAEEGKLKMLLKESPQYFEDTMSYALSFGTFTTWAKKFDDLNIPPPKWYHHSGTHNSFHSFSNSFSSSMSSAGNVMVSSPSSSGSGGSGGGSSGGGFGGGGGGSW